MSVPYALVKQVHPPTTVEQCLYCHFYNLEEKNLVVAGTTQLRIFRLIDNDVNQETADGIPPSKVKLECVQTFSLFSSIMSMQSVYIAGSAREALFLSFKEAKLSLVEYDPSSHDLKVLSLHYFEDDEGMKKGETTNCQIPIIRVDPDGRCAVALIYGKNLVVLPFRSDLSSDDTEPSFTSSSKSPLLASYTIKVSDVEAKLANIADIQFLHGYYEPTLLILYEPIKTWPGRIAVRQDTFQIVALSLNIFQKVHPIIWSHASLPYDCSQAIPVPKPLGGVLILAVNSVIYLNQSVPPYAVSLSSFTEYSTSFPLKAQSDAKISLDCAQACFIAFDKLVLSLKTGDIYVLTLMIDGMRCVNKFNFAKAASSVLTCCMCVCDEGYLFLGSRLGNSILLHYIEKEEDTSSFLIHPAPPISKADERPAKKARFDMGDEWMPTDVATIEDPEELEVYGSEAHATKELVSYTFEVCDTLLNIAPCAKICMGEPAFLSEEFSSAREFDIELVATSGHGKNGALSILQCSIRPQVVTTFELPGDEMFTVIGPKSSKVRDEDEAITNKGEEKDERHQKSTEDFSSSHAFLIISRYNPIQSTMILQTGQEINELDHSGFSTQSPTVFAANLGDNKFILQVSPMGVRLLLGSKQLQHIPLDVGSPIVWASVADPYAIILSEDGLIIQLTLKVDVLGTSARLAITRPQLTSSKSRILTFCLYKDTSGLFTVNAKPDMEIIPPVKPFPYHVPTTLKSEPKNKPSHEASDDVEVLLYGENSNDTAAESLKIIPKVEPGVKTQPVKKQTFGEDSSPTYWFIVSRDNGVLEIYSLPDFKLRYAIKNFPLCNKLLVDSMHINPLGEKMPEKVDSFPLVKEILMIGLGPKCSRPFLFARIDQEVVIYEIFSYFENPIDRHLKIRFKKVQHEMILRNWRGAKTTPKLDTLETDKAIRMRWLRPFDDISGYSGVFICGRYPHWLFMTSHGELRIHPMEVDKPVLSFAPFHNVNCPNGFLYFTGHGDLRICVLPTHLSYDAPWPVRKVPLRSTPHFVNYHVEAKTYCVVTSTDETITRIVKSIGEEKEYEVLERDERYIFPTRERFSLQLYSPVNWEPIPNTKLDLEEWEHATCLKNVMLSSEGTRSGLKGYLALGTNFCNGEDVTNRGRILILDIIDVVPEPGKPLTRNKIKIIYDKEQKGPVTELCQVSGFLLSAIGQKIYIWQLKDNELVGIAFIDTQIYIHRVHSIKNLILIADIQKSVSLLRFQENSRTLSLVSRDFNNLQVYTTDFFIDNTLLAFLVTDADQNILIYTYNPESRESLGGVRLIRKCDFNLGFHMLTTFRIKCNSAEIEPWDKSLAQQADRKNIVFGATLDGSIHYILPITEKSYRRLHMLQNLLATNIAHTAGINPKAARLCKFSWKSLTNPSKAMLDGDLIFKYLHLSVTEQQEVAKKSASTPEQIIEELLEMARYTAHF